MTAARFMSLCRCGFWMAIGVWAVDMLALRDGVLAAHVFRVAMVFSLGRLAAVWLR